MNEKIIEDIEYTVKSCLPALSAETQGVNEMLIYSLESGGKRVRPLLCLMFCRAAGGKAENALYFAAAVEYIHAYSLIHDDLPCMDNDDFRRGRLSSHKKFGEANALLAGDALLTHAFHILALAQESAEVTASQCLSAVKELSALAGASGMVGGQYIDLMYENKEASPEVLFTMDSLKTGALIEAACVLGCIAASAGSEKINAARDFARNLGLAFQITDDILEYNDENNSDILNGKSTYVSVFGIEKASSLAADFTKKAVDSLSAFQNADELRDFALGLLKRKK
ncbi:MAG: polyprenyl synthetase family protein [Oscillospiraceae bacterium]|nr:polyprenyl synthetase family protein [Oscillospiraceae bacterium]